MNSVVLSLGTNVGDKAGNMKTAMEMLEKIPFSIRLKSSLYETAAWGNTNQDSFYNMVIEGSTVLPAGEVMEQLLAVEKKMGRERHKKWEPRIMDLDILYFNDAEIILPGLTVPHPHLHERRFVLAPLNEILPDKIHPVLGRSTREMLSDLKDDCEVKKLREVPHA